MASFHSNGNFATLADNKAHWSNVNFIPQSDSRFIPDKFTDARLVGCSTRVSYIGTVDQESGFFAGSHLFDSTPFTISEENIEDGYFPVRCKPSQGLRMVYLPKDDRDLEF